MEEDIQLVSYILYFAVGECKQISKIKVENMIKKVKNEVEMVGMGNGQFLTNKLLIIIYTNIKVAD